MSIATADMKEYKRIWIASRRADYFKDKTCARCGSTDNLQLHHKDKSQKISHKIWSWTKERRDAEIAKCEVLCRKCHHAHHMEERRAKIQHGTYAGYDTLHCRCAACRKASNDYRLWLKRRR